jgi:hypothetical protein
VCDQREQTIADSLRKAGSLRQSILKHSFECKAHRPLARARHLDLISGDHAASALLQRIQDEKERSIT